MRIGYIKKQKLPLKVINKIKYFCGKIEVCEYEQECVFQVPILEEKKMNIVLKRLHKKLEKAKIDTIIFSEECMDSHYYPKMKEALNHYCILTGKRLMYEMNYDILEYIFNIRNTTMKQEDVFFLIKRDNNLDLQFLSKFVENCRTVNIVTNDIERFRKVQERLYEKEDILISVSNNKMKSLKRAKYILNVNLTKKELDKFKINRHAIIINFGENILYDHVAFDGINVNYFQINMPDEYIETLENMDCFEEFDDVRLYEGILLKKVEIAKQKVTILSKEQLEEHKNIISRIIKEDTIHITGLIGNNGKIRKEEFIEHEIPI